MNQFAQLDSIATKIWGNPYFRGDVICLEYCFSNYTEVWKEKSSTSTYSGAAWRMHRGLTARFRRQIRNSNELPRNLSEQIAAAVTDVFSEHLFRHYRKLPTTQYYTRWYPLDSEAHLLNRRSSRSTLWLDFQFDWANSSDSINEYLKGVSLRDFSDLSR